jgi:hypothetical protein
MGHFADPIIPAAKRVKAPTASTLFTPAITKEG